MEAEKFWMVWSPSGRSPTYRHPTRESADAEARRLARHVPGGDFFVLKAVGGWAAKVSEPAEIELKRLPELTASSNDEPAF